MTRHLCTPCAIRSRATSCGARKSSQQRRLVRMRRLHLLRRTKLSPRVRFDTTAASPKRSRRGTRYRRAAARRARTNRRARRRRCPYRRGAGGRRSSRRSSSGRRSSCRRRARWRRSRRASSRSGHPFARPGSQSPRNVDRRRVPRSSSAAPFFLPKGEPFGLWCVGGFTTPILLLLFFFGTRGGRSHRAAWLFFCCCRLRANCTLNRPQPRPSKSREPQKRNARKGRRPAVVWQGLKKELACFHCDHCHGWRYYFTY